MPTTENFIESLLNKTENYGKTHYTILKLKAANKTADVSSRFLSRSLLVMALSFFALFINIGLSFWLGEILGKVYYGFGVIAGFYAVLSIIFLTMHRSFVKKMKDQFIAQLLN
ncbi:MAG: hypothetical protein EA358_08085 [Flavobacteriales bacterium]|nr:MAG: hypothetical protein EA358_08085 [Flavobacteriales bacterium]